MKKTELSILFALIFSFVFLIFADVSERAKLISNTTLRVHIIADDNSIESKNIKMNVQSDIFTTLSLLCKDSDNFDSAVKNVESNLDYIKIITDNSLAKQNADYTSYCSVENIYFGTSLYKNLYMPRGDYTALVIRLGSGSGKNWWGVLYPDLSIACSSELEGDDESSIYSSDSIQIKLKCVELWQDLIHDIKSEKKYDKF